MASHGEKREESSSARARVREVARVARERRLDAAEADALELAQDFRGQPEQIGRYLAQQDADGRLSAGQASRIRARLTDALGPSPVRQASAVDGAHGRAAPGALSAAAVAPPGTPRLAPLLSEMSQGPGAEIPYRDEMERAFGEDFSGVRAHLGRRQTLRRYLADAAAVGEDVLFAATQPSRAQVAHELTHVVQARRWGVATGAALGGPASAAEAEARGVASRLAAGAGPAFTVAAAPAAFAQFDLSEAQETAALAEIQSQLATIADLSPETELTEERRAAIGEVGARAAAELLPEGAHRIYQRIPGPDRARLWAAVIVHGSDELGIQLMGRLRSAADAARADLTAGAALVACQLGEEETAAHGEAAQTALAPSSRRRAPQRGVLDRLERSSLRVVNEETPQTVTVGEGGPSVSVYGATDAERTIIADTLALVPPAHVRTIPRIVIADNIGESGNASGGATVPEYPTPDPNSRGWYAWVYYERGWVQRARLDVKRDRLASGSSYLATVDGRPRSQTILHELGHHVDAAYRVSGRARPGTDGGADDLGNVSYGGSNRRRDANGDEILTPGQTPGTTGARGERFAQAYMYRYTRRLGAVDRTGRAAAFLERELDPATAAAGSSAAE